jgi:hypothetical protein
MPRDVREHRIPREQDGIPVDGALRDVCIRCRRDDPPRTQGTPQVAHAHPVAARRFVERKLAKQVFDGGSLSCPPHGAHELCDDDGREDHHTPLERFFQGRCRHSREKVDPDGRVSDHAASASIR